MQSTITIKTTGTIKNITIYQKKKTLEGYKKSVNKFNKNSWSALGFSSTIDELFTKTMDDQQLKQN